MCCLNCWNYYEQLDLLPSHVESILFNDRENEGSDHLFVHTLFGVPHLKGGYPKVVLVVVLVEIVSH